MPRIKIVPSGTTSAKKTASAKKSGKKKKKTAKTSAKATKAAFDPAEMLIARNDRVFWFNGDTQTHEISLTGETLKPGETSDPVVITGDTVYSCTLHKGEKGTIKIKP
jgi:plastocyanin